MPKIDWGTPGAARIRRAIMVVSMAATASGIARVADAQSDIALPEVDVVASRLDLLGSSATASQGTVTMEELDLRPIFRIGQLLETVPGLVVTVHSGEGKANQYLIHGFNLDHGTDFATYVDDMPVNEPTHAHGQGYSDIHFLMPELSRGLDYTKGPFYGDIGDFGTMGSAHIHLADTIPAQISISTGTLRDDRVFLGGAELRILGPYPLLPDNSLRSPGYKEVNLVVGYKINERMKFQLSIYNLFNTTADASQYAYSYQVSPTAAPETGATYHPLEPLSARLTFTALF